MLGDLTVALLFLGWMLPLGPVIEVLSVAPMAALAYRRRFRAVIAAGLACSSVGFMLGGVNLWSVALVISELGLAIGVCMRRGWGRVRLLLCGLVVWALVAGVTVGQLALFASFRKLAFDQIRNSWHGVRRILNLVFSWWAGTHALLVDGDHFVTWMIRHWWGVIPVGEALLVEGVLLLAARFARPSIRALERSMGRPDFLPDPRRARSLAEIWEDGSSAPVPVQMQDVSFRYPDAEGYALSDVNVEIPEGSYVAVVGRNGSGKSTLARVTAGMLQPEGCVSRPGPVGLGRPGGTAVVFQRPESQVLGVRVRDDLVWGMDPVHARAVDVPALLDRVGLSGMEEEETSTLSGGQLQRLAIASALARHPRLLVSDESTSMLDPLGRRQVADLLASLSQDGEITVLHVTHRAEEAAAASTVVRVDGGSVEAGP